MRDSIIPPGGSIPRRRPSAGRATRTPRVAEKENGEWKIHVHQKPKPRPHSLMFENWDVRQLVAELLRQTEEDAEQMRPFAKESICGADNYLTHLAERIARLREEARGT